MIAIKALCFIVLLGFTSGESDLGDPLTPEDFAYSESAEYRNEVMNESEHDEDGSPNAFEGDISLSQEDLEVLEERGIPGLREVVGHSSRKWPKGRDGLVKIPLFIPTGLSKKRKADIAKAVAEYKKKTCIRFVKYNGEKRKYVKLHADPNVCESPLGMMTYYNKVVVGKGCSMGNIIHELMHSLGFFHEHTRSDRDKYVNVLWNKIPKDWKKNFYKCNDPRSAKIFGGKCQDLKVGYDYRSIMHYSKYLMNKLTIQPKKKGVQIGQRSGLSKKDVQGIKEHYGCK